MPKTFQERGLADIAKDLAWELTTVNNRPAYRFPIYISNGELVCHRLKFVDGHDPRYLFEPNQPKNAKYYYALSALDAIRKSETVFVCEGEPDVLTMYALGYGNTLCWFNGAKGGPASFWEDVKRMGAKRVVYIPDVDYVGLDAAAKLIESHALFTEHDPSYKINLRVLRLHGEIGTDLNDVYIANGFNLDIHKLKQWTYESLKSFADYLKPLRKGKVKQIENKDINPAVAQAIIAKALDGGKYNHDQTRIDILSPSPHNQDKPGQHAQFFVENLTAYDYAHGEWFGTQDLVKAWNIDVESLGGWFDTEQTPQDTPAQEKQGQGASFSPKTTEYPQDLFVSDKDALESAMLFYAGKASNNLKVIPNPFVALHSLGGFAENLTEGKVMVIAALSGGGKTTITENAMDYLVTQGYTVMDWSGEWTPTENALRRVQRYGGASINQVFSDMVYRQKIKQGLQAQGGLTINAREQSLQLSHDLMHAPETGQWGRLIYFNAKYSHWTLSDSLKAMGDKIIQERLCGNDVHIVRWDYIQLANVSNERAKNEAELAFSMFKQFCIQYRVIGLMTSQVTKSATGKVQSGGSLGAGDAQFIRADMTNIMAFLSPVIVNDIELPYLEFRVVKNSLGNRGYVYLDKSKMVDLLIDTHHPVPPKQVRDEIEYIEKQAKQKNEDEKFKLGV